MLSACKIPDDRQKKTAAGEGSGRIYFFLLIIFGAGALVACRLFFLQVADHEKWVALAEDQHLAFQELLADRGEIYMRDGAGEYPLAVNREYEMAYVSPKNVTDKNFAALQLSRILQMDAQEIRAKLERPDDPFEIVKKKISPEESRALKDAKIEGVGLLPERYRYYPAGVLASQVLGFLPGEGQGYGIEAALDARLKGISGEMAQEKDAAGRWIPLSDREVVSARNGDKIVLSLDRVVQYEAEKILREAVESFQADRATAIVMNPQTGALLAMASVPQFDPNAYSAVEDYTLFMNPSVSFSYEPGSIMKPITMAIGIEVGKVAPTTEYVDAGAVEIGGYTIRNSEDKVYGRSSMMKVLEESINTGVIFVEKQVGNRTFGEYVRRFGFGEKTKVALPAELAGNIKNLDNVRSDIQHYTASFGQGISVTPLQMVMAYGALANGGQLLKPQIIDRVIHPDGSVDKTEREVIRQVVSEETSQKIGTMLRNVVVNGHGKRADVPGYLVGGKTGTAQVAKSDAQGYEDGLTIGSFIGYAPVNDPQFVILVKIDNPKTVQWAESSAAPTFAKIMKFLLEYERIQPTEASPEKKG